MSARDMVLLSLLTALVSPACTKKPDDEAVRSHVVGLWTWNPRAQLPADKIEDDTGIYATPDHQILEFGATVPADDDRGGFVEYRHVPTNKNMQEAWVIWRRGPWYVRDGTIQVQGKLETTFNVLRVNANELRLEGVGFACKDGCVLRPLKNLPEAAKHGRPF